MERKPDSRPSSELPVESRYAPIAELGRGGMATALLSLFRGPGGFNKLVVVKRLRPALAAEADFLRMFLDEARLSARIDHPNVVHTSEVGFDGTNYFIAMEFLDGQPLENIVRRAKASGAAGRSIDEIDAAPGIPLNLGLHVLVRMLDALHYAHELKDFDGTPLKVVHRDVSPHNVMVTYEGHVKLLDFGIAKAADTSTETKTGVIKGKCAYMAPEQFGGVEVDRRVDIFAAGVILWQVLTGRRLWKGLSDAQIFAKLAKKELPLPSSAAADVDPELEAVCMKALAADRDERFATAADFQTALERWIDARSERRASSRDLGAFVSELFGAERAKIQALIEAQLARNRSADGEMMNLAEYFGNSSTRPAEASPVPEPVAVSPRRYPKGLAAVAGAGLALVIGVAAVVTRSHASAPAARPSAELVVRVQPADARVMLDEVLLQGSPPSGSFALDGAPHRMRAEAPGFVQRTETVVLDSERVSMDITLEPQPVVAAAAMSATPTATTAAAPPEPTRAPAWPAHAPPPRAGRRTPEPPPSPPPPPAPSAAPSVAPTPTPTATHGPALDKSDPWAQQVAKP